jgi:hypothetical protein
MTKPTHRSEASEEAPSGTTLDRENAFVDVRFPVEPLLLKLGIVIADAGGQQAGQALEGASLLAVRLQISVRMAQFLLEGRPERPGSAFGLTVAQADRYAVAAGFLPWEVWASWLSSAPGELDLRSKRCRCRASERRPIGDECDRCGRRIVSSSRRAA